MPWYCTQCTPFYLYRNRSGGWFTLLLYSRGVVGILYYFPVGEQWYTLLLSNRSKSRCRKVRPSIQTKVILINIWNYFLLDICSLGCTVCNMEHVYYVLCTMYYSLYNIYRWYCVLCTVYTMYCVLCTQQYSGGIKKEFFSN